MPKVDVIIPAYNAAKYLPTAIESVVAQTFEDWRILLVDDGSTDDTAAVVSRLFQYTVTCANYSDRPEVEEQIQSLKRLNTLLL